MNTSNDKNLHLSIQRQGGHYYVAVRTTYIAIGTHVEIINFILDTGAFITVISRDTARLFGYDRLPKIPSKIKGYAGEVSADFVRIPCLEIQNVCLNGVPTLIPHSNALHQNILGLNVLEYFDYYIETSNDAIHLKPNPNPRHYHSVLKCDQVIINP